MIAAEAQVVLDALIQGLDPDTKEPIPRGTIFDKKNVRDALVAALYVLAFEAFRDARKAAAPENHGKPWSPEEDQRLLAEHNSRMARNEVAKAHGRTLGAIKDRLESLGLITTDGEQ